MKMKAVRQTMLEDGKWCRKTINEALRIIRHWFKWVVGNEEVVSGSVYHSLLAVEGLRKGRSTARESEPVRPVPEAWIDATLKHLSPVVQDSRPDVPEQSRHPGRFAIRGARATGDVAVDQLALRSGFAVHSSRMSWSPRWRR
jgi:hypothetical protein